MMKSGVSAGNACASCVSGCRSSSSCHHTSRPGAQGMSSPVRRTTSTCCTWSSPATAASAFSFTGTAPPRRNCPSLVTSSFAPVSSTRKRSASAENPPNTSEWMAPSRATASVTITVSSSTGR